MLSDFSYIIPTIVIQLIFYVSINYYYYKVRLCRKVTLFEWIYKKKVNLCHLNVWPISVQMLESKLFKQINAEKYIRLFTFLYGMKKHKKYFPIGFENS